MRDHFPQINANGGDFLHLLPPSDCNDPNGLAATKAIKNTTFATTILPLPAPCPVSFSSGPFDPHIIPLSFSSPFRLRPAAPITHFILIGAFGRRNRLHRILDPSCSFPLRFHPHFAFNPHSSPLRFHPHFDFTPRHHSPISRSRF